MNVVAFLKGPQAVSTHERMKIKALKGMDDRDLADIGLKRSDVERLTR